MSAPTAPIIGDLSITASTGAELTAGTDLQLAWKWAEVEVGANFGPDAWAAMRKRDQYIHVADALAELRRAHAAAS